MKIMDIPKHFMGLEDHFSVTPLETRCHGLQFCLYRKVRNYAKEHPFKARFCGLLATPASAGITIARNVVTPFEIIIPFIANLGKYTLDSLAWGSLLTLARTVRLITTPITVPLGLFISIFGTAINPTKYATFRTKDHWIGGTCASRLLYIFDRKRYKEFIAKHGNE